MTKPTPAEIAAEKIARHRMEFSTERGIQLEIKGLVTIINEALTEERAEHAKTQERHDRMAAEIVDIAEAGWGIKYELCTQDRLELAEWLIDGAKRWEKKCQEDECQY